ncbi:MAG: 2-isopropylmalate synthase [Candidatus Hydrogenedentes bacterium]|nr:2-isopropylmalate synthase [Candidatus Hydrogenedentota bacterium]
MKPVRIFDTTCRDGEQTPGVHMSPSQKVAIARRLEAFGVDTIEAGFPASSPGDFAAVQAVAEVVERAEVAALARCAPRDIDQAAEALKPARRPVVHVVIGVSDVHMRHKLNMTRAEVIRAIEQSVRRARGHVAEVECSFEDATRAEPAFLRQCIEAAIGAGATRVNIPDTVGCAMPDAFGAMIRDIVAFVEGRAIVSVHCHNDLGMATANTVAAVQNGADQVEVTVNGIGERAGNTAMEEVAVALHLQGIAQVNVDFAQITAISRMVAETTGVPVQPNRAIVGAYAFTHSSGIHQDGIIKAPEVYEFVPPQLVGVEGHRFVMTARSGRRALAHVARQMGYPFTPEQIDAAYARFIHAADEAKGAVDEAIVAGICEDVVRTWAAEKLTA